LLTSDTHSLRDMRLIETPSSSPLLENPFHRHILEQVASISSPSTPNAPTTLNVPGFRVVPIPEDRAAAAISALRNDPILERINPMLPRPTFSLFILAPTFSGKTTLILNLLTRRDAYRGIFDAIFIVSPTVNIDPLWNKVEVSRGAMFSQWDEEAQFVLCKALADQTRRMELLRNGEIEPKDMPRYLFVFDDIVGQGIGDDKMLREFATKARWANTSLIISSQRFREVARELRVNATDFALYDNPMGGELDAVAQELRGTLTRKEFFKVYREAVKEPHGFLHVTRSANPDLRFRASMHSFIQI